MAQYDGSLRFDTKLDSDGFSNGINKLGSIAKGGLAIVGASIAGITTGFVAMSKAALSSVADLEQNIGGIETLFKGSAQTVIENANNAYKTAGLSANEYMQNVTSFSASLLQSVAGDTAEAAKIADMAMVDMSDNANKMGTSMELIQNAYQSFAKQNYTMLDNLKLGYGGTKEEMQRLLEDAEKISGVKYDIANLSDVYEAIHIIQGELGITGTTAEEAASTITGSMASAKAAFDNFLNGQGTAEELTESLITAADNIISNLAEILPRLAETVPLLLQGLAEGIAQNSDQLIAMGSQILNGLVNGIFAVIPLLAEAALSIINSLTQGLMGALGEVESSGQSSIAEFVNGLLQKLPDVIAAGGQVLNSLVNQVLTGLPQILQAGIQLIGQLAQGLLNNFPAVLSAIGSVIGQLLATIASHLPDLLQKGIELVGQLAAGLIRAIPDILKSAGELVSSILDEIRKTDWLQLGKDIISGIAKGITNAAGEILDAIGDVVGGALDWAKDLLGIASPSKVFRDAVGRYIPMGMAEGIDHYSDYPSRSSAEMAKKAIASAKQATYLGGDSSLPAEIFGNEGQKPNDPIDYRRIGQEMRDALDGTQVSMDGQKVGSIVTEPVNQGLGDQGRMEERDIV